MQRHPLTPVLALAAAMLWLAAAAAQELEIDEGLVAHWKFDRLVDGAVPEETGNGSPAELVDECANLFDGSRGLKVPARPVSGHAASPALPFLQGNPTKLSVTAWVWWTGEYSAAAVSVPERFVLGPTLWEVQTVERWRALLEPHNAPSKQWLHLAGVLDGEEIVFYRDGEEVGRRSASEPLRRGSADVQIGWSFGRVKWQMPGYVRDVRIYDRPLAPAEIAQMAGVRREATPADLPRAGLYLPARGAEVAPPFEQPDVNPFVGDDATSYTLTERDAAEITMGGAGFHRVIEPTMLHETGRLRVSAELSASAPVRMRAVLVGWPEGAGFKSPRLSARVFGQPMEVGETPASFEATVDVPGDVAHALVMLTVVERREESASLVGTRIDLREFAIEPAAVTEAAEEEATRIAASVASKDGLGLQMLDDGSISRVTINARDVGGSDAFPASGWFITDIAGENVPIPLTGDVRDTEEGLVLSGRSEKLQLEYRIEMVGAGSAIRCRAHLQDLTGRERMLNLQFRMPLSSERLWSWHNGKYTEVQMEPAQRYEVRSQRLSRAGMRQASAYPFAAVSSHAGAVCLGVPLSEPACLPRLFAEQCFIGGGALGCDFDVAISPITEHFPSQADFRFVLYHTAPSFPFRRAAAEYYDLFPEQFDTTATKHGNWAVLRLRQQYIENIADFAIAVDERVTASPPADQISYEANRILGIPSCPYLRPGTWSQEFDGSPDDPDAYEVRMRVLREQAEMPEWESMFPNPYWGSSLPTLAQSAFTSLIYDEEGKASWHWPAIHREGKYFMRADLYCSYEVPEPNWAGVVTNRFRFADDWGRRAGTPTGGVYFDNMSGRSISAVDFRRENWRLAQSPLSVARNEPRPVQFKAVELCEFFPRFNDLVHERGGLNIGNIREGPFLLGQHLDFIGCEHFNYGIVEQMRTMAARRPVSYLPLGDIPAEEFEMCLCWGIPPGFGNPDQRPLYREYMPMLVELSEAGWEAVTCAGYSGEQVRVERFGSFDAGTLSFTVYDRLRPHPDGVLTVDAEELGIDGDIVVLNRRTEQPIDAMREGTKLIVAVPCEAGRTEVVRICRPEDWRRKRLTDVADALDRARREWEWVQAQHDETLIAYLEFEDGLHRWFREGFLEPNPAEVGPVPDAHAGDAALHVSAEAPSDGVLKTEPFTVRQDVPVRIAFWCRAEGRGPITATAVFLPSWFGGLPSAETELAGFAPPDGWDEGWRRFEVELDVPEGDVARVYLRLEFEGFVGRFALDSFEVCPVFEPLAEIPRFGFADRETRLRAELEAGDLEGAAGVVGAIGEQIAGWREMAAVLPDGDAARMNVELDVIEESVAAAL